MLRVVSLLVSLMAALIVCACFCRNDVIMASADQKPSEEQIIKGVDHAEQERENDLAAYDVTERYRVYRPGVDGPIGEASYSVKYLRGVGKTFEQLDVSTHRAFVRKAIERTVHAEEEVSKARNRASMLITSANYLMSLVDKDEPSPSYICSYERPARRTRVLTIKPRYRSPELIDGFIWVDAETYRIVRVQGIFSDSPSIFVGRPQFERDYEDMSGFAMAKSSCSRSQSRLSHDMMQIVYEKYVVRR